jgi:pimeloyl-ACP methyl ester carboxylesterase
VAVALALVAPAEAVDLAPCPEHPEGLCGSIAVPFDRADPSAGTIDVAFELYPRTDQSQPALGTILASGGGPGGSTTADRDVWLMLFGALRDRRDILLIDHRGTGKSGAVDCEAAQHGIGDPFEAISACAEQLGDGADRYTVVDVVEDIEVVRRALGIEELDYYGVSYGTVYGQAYALRHGEHLRSIVLDSALPIPERDDNFDLDADLNRATGRVVALLCERSATCSTVPGNVTLRFRNLVSRLRSHPVEGRARDFLGNPVDVVVDEAAILKLLYGFTLGILPAAALDGAGLALDRGDTAPIVRLAAESGVPLDNGDPALFSAGMNLSSWCNDASMPWDKSAPFEAREAQWHGAVAALAPATFAPFSLDGWQQAVEGFVQASLVFRGCLAWPAPDPQLSPLIPPGSTYPAAPTLVMNGDIDLVTPVSWGQRVASLFPRSSFVEFSNAGHGILGTIFQGPCAADVVARFIDQLDPGDTTCASEPLPVFGYSLYPLRVADEPALGKRLPGDGTTARDRRAVVAAFDTVLDNLLYYNPLRGGRQEIEFTDTGFVLHLHAARFVSDLTVDGLVRFDFQRQIVRVEVTISGRGADAGSLRMHFGPTTGTVRVLGSIGGRGVNLVLPNRN